MHSLVLVEIFFSWGFILKPPYLALGGKTLSYPPPTTLVGALTYPYMKITGDTREVLIINNKPYSPASKLLDKVKYAVMGYPEPRTIQIVDINRYASYGYIRDDYKRRMEMWFSIMGVGKNYTPYKSVIAYLVDSRYIDEISKVAWGISRIGSKEGLVSVTKVVTIRNPQILQNTRVETIFPVPADLVSNTLENTEKIRLWRLSREAYSSISRVEEFEEYYVPKHPGGVYGGKMFVEINPDKSIVYETPYGPLIIPKHMR